VVVALAVAAFVCAWSVLHVGFFDDEQIVDTPVYESYGGRMENGDVPYRDFRAEYPPGALAVFAAPSLLSEDSDGYRVWFETLMVVAGAAMLAAMAWAGASAAALAFAAVAPLALGSVVLTRFDLVPAALVAAAVAALVRGRDRLGHALVGAGVVVKLFPGVLLPLAVAWTWRRRGRREALACLGLCLALVVVAFLPFLVIAPEGFLASFGRQLSRPLQIETLGAAVLVVSPLDVAMHSSHGSQNLEGTGVWLVAALQSALQLAAIVWIWWAHARGRLGLVQACAAVLVAFVALGKVLSPQFLIWLVPLVPLVRGRRGVAAGALLALALVLTQLWFPFRYWDYALGLDEGIAAIVLARDLALVALLVTLVRGRARST
jgi:hypothetical protein